MFKFFKLKKNFFENILNIPQLQRKLILLFFDILLIPTALYLTYWLKISNQILNKLSHYTWIPITLFLFSIPLYLITGQYRSLTRYFSSQVVYFIALRNLFLLSLTIITGYFINLQQPKFSTWLLIWILITIMGSTIRLLIRDIISSFKEKPSSTKKIAIYGAGQTGALLADNLKLKNFDIKFFIDDDKNLWGRTINGLKVFPLSHLTNSRKEIDQILIAIPSLKKEKLKFLINWISNQNVKAYKVPSLEDITKGRTNILDLKPISVEQILGREIAPPDIDLIKSAIFKKTILITGGGGSIGSELFKQIILYNPLKVVVLDNNENHIHKLHLYIKELEKRASYKLVLASACDKKIINKIFSTYKFDLVFHAAAYKHVPIVEENQISGLKNNIFSTKLIAETSIKYGVKNVLLISSDKAVRPSNLMGVSKRISELIFKACDLNRASKKTIFSMVRFGNVLESSGSVVPLFRAQIAKGGPITLTHRNITRYFMTIKEAAQLLLQSTAISNGGEIFLLEMGEPVRIEELAKQMITLSGLQLKNKKNPNGDIEIKTTGLRSGEKLYEELLVDNNSEPTIHPLIYKAKEQIINKKIFEENFEILEKGLNENDLESVLKIIKLIVPEWKEAKI
tara:strand:- start:55800 stop:57680 length:1881 start_codon:yes stop_codon:yes gene_type:complete